MRNRINKEANYCSFEPTLTVYKYFEFYIKAGMVWEDVNRRSDLL